MKPVQIFPYTLVRISGGSIDDLEALNFKEAAGIINNYACLEENLKFIKNNISEKLYVFIPTLPDKILQNIMLHLRRDVFNDRELTQERIDSLATILPQEILSLIKKYAFLIHDKTKVSADGEASYQQQCSEMKGTLDKIISNELLQKGLLLSSQDILNRIPSYLTEKNIQEKKRSQIEQGLLKYITRMHTKTSPFSTFTNLGIATHNKPFNPNENFISFNNSKHEIKSHIRLNNFLFQYLKTLLTLNPDIYIWFSVRINPTIRKTGEVFYFMTNFNNTDAFQRIRISPALEHIYTLCMTEKGGIAFQYLIDKIISTDIFDVSVEQTNKYIKQLIDFGFLEYNLSVSGTDTNWDIQLVRQLTLLNIKNTLVEELIQVLNNMRELATAYGNADVTSRKIIIDSAYSNFRNICMKLHEAAGLPESERKTREEMIKLHSVRYKEYKIAENKKKAEIKRNEKIENNVESDNIKPDEQVKGQPQSEPFKKKLQTHFYFKPENIFYEDTSLNGDIQLNPVLLKTLMTKVISLEEAMDIHNMNEEEQIKMNHFYDQHYQNLTETNLLDYYEKYYLLFKKVEKEYLQKVEFENSKKLQEKSANKESDSTGMGIEIPDILKIKELQTHRDLKSKWDHLMQNKIIEYNDHQTNISLNDIHQVNLGMNIHTNKKHRKGSKGIFVQFFQECNEGKEAKLLGVLNSGFPGLMKLMSRFLHIFETGVTDTAREYNLNLQTENLLLAEDCDSSYFNANLHPPLLPFEVWMPNSHTNLPEEQQIPVTDMKVVKRDSKLALIHIPTGKELYVFDLGFQGHAGRSELFQLLDKFNSNRISLWYNLISNVYAKVGGENTQANSNDQIHIRPRIIVDDQLIIARKTWFIPKLKLPIRQQKESDWNYFITINCWIKEHNIPNEVFINVTNRNQKPQNKEEEKRYVKLSRDDYKPQYINFQNPFLVKMFEKLALKVVAQMTIVEMLPNSSQLIKIGNKKYVTEYLIQWYDA